MPLTTPLLRPSRLAWVLSLAVSVGAVALMQRLPAPEAPLGQGMLALLDVSVYDPQTKTLREHQDLVWTDGRISALRPTGKTAPSGATIIPGKGLTALPGLCDAAVFLSLEGRYPQASVPADPAASLRQQLSDGVTSLLDLNAHRTFMAKAREIVEQEPGPWPRLRFAGALFAAPGGWRIGGQTPWDSHVAELTEIDDLQASWPVHLRFHDQAVFASVEHEGRQGLAIPLPVLQRLGELAHAQGVPFIIQVQHPAKALAALAAQPDAFLGPLVSDEDVPALALAMKRQGCAYLPALGTVLNGWPGKEIDPGSGDPGDPVLKATWEKHLNRQGLDRNAMLKALSELYQAGVPLALGTGSGLPLVRQGSGRFVEMGYWLEAGVPVAEFLRAATLTGHRLLGLEGGLLRPGNRADLMLVEGDPLRDPSRLREVRSVYVGGVAVARP